MSKSLFVSSLILFIMSGVCAQDITVEEIIDNYLENTGGKDNWRALKGLRTTASLNQGGLEIPLEIVQLSDGRQYTKFIVQDREVLQSVYDGETLWSTNFQSLTAEKLDEETTANFKLDLNDFPDAFLDYGSKGYSVALMGSEEVEGTEAFKVKLTKEPRTIAGRVVEDVRFFYFDKETFIPIAQDAEIAAGPQGGGIQRVLQGDFAEVGGLYFPFTLRQGLKDGPMQPISIQRIEVNPAVDESLFTFPGN